MGRTPGRQPGTVSLQPRKWLASVGKVKRNSGISLPAEGTMKSDSLMTLFIILLPLGHDHLKSKNVSSLNPVYPTQSTVHQRNSGRKSEGSLTKGGA